MARRKRTSRELEKAKRREAAVLSIDPNFDLGNGLTQTAYNSAIAAVEAENSAYNTLLSTLDEALNKVKASEKVLKDWSERILVGVAAKYGKDSDQYEMAGGVRKSERKKPARKSPSA